MQEGGFPDWVKIPAKMQSQFFELAEKQAREVKTKLLKDKEKLNKLARLLHFSKIVENDEWKKWRAKLLTLFQMHSYNKSIRENRRTSVYRTPGKEKLFI